MKKSRGERSKPPTNILKTPVGTYLGEDVLEGFAADAEHLGRPTSDTNIFDNSFYKLCALDNIYIFDFKGEDTIDIPPMAMTDLNHIIHKKMKLGKACDIYQMTVEHLRYCGEDAKIPILKLINKIIKSIYSNLRSS